MKLSKPIPYIPMAQEKAQGRAEFIKAKFVPLSEIRPVLDSLYVVKTWLDSGASSVIYGESNVGKTFLALDLGLHVAAGTAWHGHRVRQGHVI